MPSRLSESGTSSDWLEQFERADQPTAKTLLDEVMLVGRDEFYTSMFSLIDEAFQRQKDRKPLALYAERTIKKVFGRIPSFFPNARHGRAVGPGIAPIVVDARDQEVGSEGPIAQLITDYCRLHQDRGISHPGPDSLRKEKVRTILIVTDCIGSGQRIFDMLESFRYVATLRSWHSYSLLTFGIATYAATLLGRRRVEAHPLRPVVNMKTSAPSLATTFRGAQFNAVETLCSKYPKSHHRPLGFGGIGALIAFAHGCPNNAPALLHSSAGGWKPMFPRRSTLGVNEIIAGLESEVVQAARAEAILDRHKAQSALLCHYDRRWIKALLILESAQRGIHSVAAISARTYLPVADVQNLLAEAKTALWLEQNGVLTELGRQELAMLKRERRRSPLVLSNQSQMFYYPTQLRAPIAI